MGGGGWGCGWDGLWVGGWCLLEEKPHVAFLSSCRFSVMSIIYSLKRELAGKWWVVVAVWWLGGLWWLFGGWAWC